MTIADKITRLQTAKTAIANAITAKGGTVASGDGFEDFATDIGTIATQKEEQSKTVTPNAAGQTVTPDSGNVLSSVVINGDADLVAGNIKKDVNIFGVTGTLEAGKNPHSTTWDFSSRTERRLNSGHNGSYYFNSDSSYEFLLYLPTDDTCWINGGYMVPKVKVLSAGETLWSTVSDITQTGFKFTARTGKTENCILIPYFLKSGQTISITYTRSDSNFGGHVVCDTHGRYLSREGRNQTGAATSTYTYTATQDCWFYWLVGKYDGGATVTLSNCSVTIS